MGRTLLLAAMSLFVVGCSAEAQVGRSSDEGEAEPVSARTLEKRGAVELSRNSGLQVQLECSEALPPKQDAKVYCTGRAEGHDVDQDVRVRVTDIDGDEVSYHLDMLQLAPGPAMARSVKEALVGAGAPTSISLRCPKLVTIEEGRSFECDATGIKEDTVTVTFTDDDGAFDIE